MQEVPIVPMLVPLRRVEPDEDQPNQLAIERKLAVPTNARMETGSQPNLL
jgi:hypothetical protein